MAQSQSCTCRISPCDCTGVDKSKHRLSQALLETGLSQDGSDAVDKNLTDNRYNFKGELLEGSEYDKLVKRLQADGGAVINRCNVNIQTTGDNKEHTVPRHVVTQRSFTKGGRKYTCRNTHPGSAAVLFQLNGVTSFGFINTIWDQSISGVIRRHVLVSPLKVMDSKAEAKSPFSNWPGWRAE